MSTLVLVRHGISEYNKKGLWTGWINVELSPEGYEEARRAGGTIKDIQFNHGYSPDLKRCTETLQEIKKVINQKDLVTTIHPALRERNYGQLAGKNKWKIKEEYGDAQFMKWRRGWDEPIPDGESLKDVYNRLIPYYQQHIEPKLKNNKNILISGSGNSLRALVKYLEQIPNDQIAKLEIGTGEVYIYEINPHGTITSKEIRSTNPKKGKV
ncbi:MAG: 2,3-bisphosphoglycerate-dependent phosphoglycerate mutase [Microgenomates group bacterium GW2011_GWA2_44_7]|nr:MAG: 2,3-bisphosphoglycerate-dependent phosphoglycerate mutase [Microgenomates group bacterium GW2011_GWA2_44_7]